ncbi:hypothetical protein TWF694_007645 [Orbilia ellipsospora]|uniref:Uncharacterized protein n=1 Tax=Orbilia ellipsospora TaxID=2528407 RepID=A0AAV9XLR4_9PEZI
MTSGSSSPMEIDDLLPNTYSQKLIFFSIPLEIAEFLESLGITESVQSRRENGDSQGNFTQQSQKNRNELLSFLEEHCESLFQEIERLNKSIHLASSNIRNAYHQITSELKSSQRNKVRILEEYGPSDKYYDRKYQMYCHIKQFAEHLESFDVTQKWFKVLEGKAAELEATETVKTAESQITGLIYPLRKTSKPATGDSDTSQQKLQVSFYSDNSENEPEESKTIQGDIMRIKIFLVNTWNNEVLPILKLYEDIRASFADYERRAKSSVTLLDHQSKFQRMCAVKNILKQVYTIDLAVYDQHPFHGIKFIV